MRRMLLFLGSGWLRTVLIALLLISYLVMPADEKFSRWIKFASDSTAGIVLILLTLANIVLSAISNARGKLAPAVLSVSAIKAMDTYAEIARPEDFNEIAKKIGLRIKARGFAQSGRWSFLPGLILRAGIVMLVIALLLSAHLRKTEYIMLTEGRAATALGRHIALKGINSDLPAEFLQMGETGSFRIKNVSAQAQIDDKPIALDAGFPTASGTFFFRVSDMDFAAEIILDGRDKVSLNLDVLPPGNTAKVEIGGETLTFRLEPEKTIKKGLITGKLYNLKTPFYRIALLDKDGRQLGETTLRAGTSAEVAGLKISLSEPMVFLKIQVVRDPALWLVYLGLITALLGLSLMPLRFFWYEKRLAAMASDGKLLLGYSEEFYKKWAVARFHKIIERLGKSF